MDLAAIEPLVAQLNRINRVGDVDPSVSVAQLTPPSSLAMERFNAVMNASPVSPPGVVGTDVSLAVSPASTAPAMAISKPTLGEDILAQLTGMLEQVSGGASRINDRLAVMATKEPTTADLLALQVETMSWSLSTTYGTNVISSLQKSVDSLTRMS